MVHQISHSDMISQAIIVIITNCNKLPDEDFSFG